MAGAVREKARLLSAVAVLYPVENHAAGGSAALVLILSPGCSIKLASYQINEEGDLLALIDAAGDFRSRGDLALQKPDA